MGNDSPSAKLNEELMKSEDSVLTRESFEFISIIGKGGFGKVWKVKCKKYDDKIYAMKEMYKEKIIEKKSEKAIKEERNLLSKMNHPFLINMNFSFQDRNNLYVVLDYCSGGDIRYHMTKFKKFNEEQSKFFMACAIMGLEYVHSNNIIHRDIKPENFVLEENGYVKLTDFGIAQIPYKGNKTEVSGTISYMAPEVLIEHQDYTKVVDYYALGIMGYEFMKGVRPYNSIFIKEMKEEIMAKQACIKQNNISEGWSFEAADFINKLLLKKANQRLGFKGIQELRNHSWFKGFNWKDLYLKKLKAPFIPPAVDNFDAKYVNEQPEIDPELMAKYKKIKDSSEYKTAFEDYFYFNRLNETILSKIPDKCINPHLKEFNLKEEEPKPKKEEPKKK